MTKEALRLALYTIEYTFACSKNQLTTKTKREYDQDLLMKAITAIKEALETKDRPVQVSPFEFVEIVYEKECLIGRPIVWAQWPNEEKNT